MSSTILKRGEPVNIGGESIAIEHAGPSGFNVKGRLGMLRWQDRGVTWSSGKRDRLDATREQFRQAAGKE